MGDSLSPSSGRSGSPTWPLKGLATDLGDHELLAAHTTPTTLDLNCIFLAGESAGGLIGVNFALAHPKEIGAATSCYPAVALESPNFTIPRTKATLPFGHQTDESILHKILASATPGTANSSSRTQDRLEFMMAAIEYGRLGEWYGRDAKGSPREGLLYPFRSTRATGRSGSAGRTRNSSWSTGQCAPIGEVDRFVAQAEEVTQGVTLVKRDGEHEFDVDVSYKEEWIQEAFKAAVETWLEGVVRG